MLRTDHVGIHTLDRLHLFFQIAKVTGLVRRFHVNNDEVIPVESLDGRPT